MLSLLSWLSFSWESRLEQTFLKKCPKKHPTYGTTFYWLFSNRWLYCLEIASSWTRIILGMVRRWKSNTDRCNIVSSSHGWCTCSLRSGLWSLSSTQQSEFIESNWKHLNFQYSWRCHRCIFYRYLSPPFFEFIIRQYSYQVSVFYMLYIYNPKSGTGD